MKRRCATTLFFLFALVSTQVFSQNALTSTDTSRQVEELAAKLSTSPVFFNYFTVFDSIARSAIANMSVKSATEEWKRLYKEARDKVHNDQTLNEREKTDSIQSIFYTFYQFRKSAIDTIAGLTNTLYTAFPELSKFTRATAFTIFEKAHKIIDAEKRTKETSPDYDKIFTKVEHPPVFPGGQRGWLKYLAENLDADVPVKDKAPAGLYPVTVQFIVDQQGNVSNVQAIQTPAACPHCGPEAVKAIRKGPKWQPAIQNGRTVVFQDTRTISFQVSN